MTHARRIVHAALRRRRDHPTADELWDEVRAELPSLSRTTVYRTLDTLVRVGAATRICHPGASARYDAVLERHDHVVCAGCGDVRDVRSTALDGLPRPRVPGFDIHEHSVYFRGTCHACRAKGRSENLP